MTEKDNPLKFYHYILSVLFVLVGTVLIAYSEIDMDFICKFAAGVFAVAGLVSIVSYCIRDAAVNYYRLDLVYGMMALFLALVFITKQDEIAEYLPILIGCILVANGVVKFQHSIDMKRIDRKVKKVSEAWLVVMIFAIICTAAGVITIYIPFSDDRALFIFVGIAFIVAGVTDIIAHFVFNRKVKSFRSEINHEESSDITDITDSKDNTDSTNSTEEVTTVEGSEMPSEITEDTAEEAPSEDAADPEA